MFALLQRKDGAAVRITIERTGSRWSIEFNNGRGCLIYVGLTNDQFHAVLNRRASALFAAGYRKQ